MDNTQIDVEALITNEFYEATEDNRGVVCSMTLVNGAVLKGAGYGHEPVANDGKPTPSTLNAWMNCQQIARAGTVELIESHERYRLQSLEAMNNESSHEYWSAIHRMNERSGRSIIGITYQDCDKPGQEAAA